MQKKEKKKKSAVRGEDSPLPSLFRRHLSPTVIRRSLHPQLRRSTSDVETLRRHSMDTSDFLLPQKTPSTEFDRQCSELPEITFAVPSTEANHVSFCMYGPGTDDDNSIKEFQNRSDICGFEIAVRCGSMYPLICGTKTRMGSPFADAYGVKHLENGVIMICIADGCGWGVASAKAAQHATAEFLKSLHGQIGVACTSMRSFCCCLFKSLISAHSAVVSATNYAGSCTLLGGAVLPVSSGPKPSRVFCFISVGDCKAFCYRIKTRTLVDLTKSDKDDLTDPGGRIGFSENRGLADVDICKKERNEPDLRNMMLNWCEYDLGDLLFIMSDGVSDNFDPMCLGQDVLQDGQEANDRSAQLCENIMTAIGDLECASSCVNALLDYCWGITTKSRVFMEGERHARLPSNSNEYPGKLDHATCICLRIVR
jgi:hypothetical protein